MRTLLQSTSTNLHHLASDPLRVLFQSLLWIDGSYWWPYLLLFTVFLAPAERWLGHLRWAVVGLICHVGATYLGEGYLYWAIQESAASPRLIDARDVGVSYFVVGIIGVLFYRMPRRWRWALPRRRRAADRRSPDTPNQFHLPGPPLRSRDRSRLLPADARPATPHPCVHSGCGDQ